MTLDKHHYYDGSIYGKVIDPALRSVREAIGEEIHEGSAAVDLACGTGSLAILLAEKCNRVLGVELSETMVDYARSRITLDADHVKIEHGDASHLPHIKDGEFDFATISMALHEMPHDVRLAVVREARRISKQTVLADFNVPIPWNFQGVRSRLAEFLAGMDHFKSSMDFQKRGGLTELVKEAGGAIQKSRIVRGGTVQIVVAR